MEPEVLLYQEDGRSGYGDWIEVGEVCRKPLPHDDEDSPMGPGVCFHCVQSPGLL